MWVPAIKKTPHSLCVSVPLPKNSVSEMKVCSRSFPFPKLCGPPLVPHRLLASVFVPLLLVSAPSQVPQSRTFGQQVWFFIPKVTNASQVTFVKVDPVMMYSSGINPASGVSVVCQRSLGNAHMSLDFVPYERMK